MKKIIGIVGPIASGKGVLISLLQKRGYDIVSLSNIVRERTSEWGLPITRENLQNVGDSLRHKFGSAILAELIAPLIKKNPESLCVVDSIRNPAEVAYLKKQFDATIIGIVASPKKRFELMQIRGRDYDPKTWEEFVKAEERDRGIGQENHGQQVEACLRMADLLLDNNGTLSDFEDYVGYFLEKNI